MEKEYRAGSRKQNLLLKQVEEKQRSMKATADGRTSDSEVTPGGCFGYS